MALEDATSKGIMILRLEEEPLDTSVVSWSGRFPYGCSMSPHLPGMWGTH